MRGKGGPRPDGRATHHRGQSAANGAVAALVADVAPAPAPIFPHGSPAPHYRATFGALDLGTNNCRLLIARPDGDDFVIVDAFSRIVRLGEGMTLSGRMSQLAMDRAVDALSVCADKLRRRRVVLSRSVATEACRRAANGDAFLARVRDETGIALDVISAEEEARLAVLGCYQSLSAGAGPALLFDIGGGSTEVALIDDSGDEPRILDWQSIPWGVVTLSEAERHDTDCARARAHAYAAMRSRVRGAMAGFTARIAPLRASGAANGHRMLGTSGTVTTLASLYLGLLSYDRSQVDGLTIAASDLRAWCARLADMPLSGLAQMPCVGRERADLVVAGCAALEEICEAWPAHSIDVADRGIREGVLRTLMRAHGARAARGQGL
ncbi:MAG: Ppx/GppA phosphatase family protein [Sphingopyxis sp.]